MTAAAVPDLTIEAFEGGAIDADRFDHEAHVYIGWLYLCRFEPGVAITRFTSALRRLTVTLGIPDKYHETVSWFFMLLIAERRGTSGGDDWVQFRRRNDDLFRPGGGILQRYYTKAALASERARQLFVLPDRLRA